jgi:hypothetical protein
MDRTDLSKYKTETGYNLAELELGFAQCVKRIRNSFKKQA